MVYADLMREGTSKSPYHHGDLPDVMMRLAIEHIEADGTEKLSLRALAREAGVSQSAPYRHFPTKRCLLAALATQGFEILHDRMAAAVTSDDPIDARFIAMGVAYVEFALDHPTHYHLMFGSVLGDFSDYEMLHRASMRAFQHVTQLQHELVVAKGLEVDEERFAGVIWASVHGIASLILNTSQKHDERARPLNAIRAVRADIEDSLRMLFNHMMDDA